MNRFIALTLVWGGVMATSPVIRAEETPRNDTTVEAKPLPQAPQYESESSIRGRQPEAKPPVVAPPTVQVKVTAARGFRTISPDTAKSWLLAECARANAEGECTLDTKDENGRLVDFVVNATLKAANGKLLIEMSLADRLDPKKKSVPAIREFENPKDVKQVRAFIAEILTTFVGAIKFILEDRSRPKDPIPELVVGLVKLGNGNGGKKGSVDSTTKSGDDIPPVVAIAPTSPLDPLLPMPSGHHEAESRGDPVIASSPDSPPNDTLKVTTVAPPPVMTRPKWPWYVAGGAGVVAALAGAVALSASSEVSQQQDKFDSAPNQRVALTAQRRGDDAASRATTYAIAATSTAVVASAMTVLQLVGVFDREE